jgi:hypothetical protein
MYLEREGGFERSAGEELVLCPRFPLPVHPINHSSLREMCSAMNVSSESGNRESVDPPIPRTSANHVAAETERRHPVVAFARYRRRCESRP